MKYTLFKILIMAILLIIPSFPIVNAGDNYIVTNGVIGSDAFAPGLILLNNTETYYYLAHITNSIQITCISLGSFSTASGNPENVTITYSIYTADGSAPMSMTNVLTKAYTAMKIHRIQVGVTTANLDGVGCQTNFITPTNSWIAIGVSVSSPIYVNNTSSSFNSYSWIGRQPQVVPRLSTFDSFYLQAPWVLYSGAQFEEPIAEPTYDLFDFHRIFIGFASQYGVGADTLEILFIAFSIISIFVFFRKRNMEISFKALNLLIIGLIAMFFFMGISPLWFTITMELLCISLLIGNTVKTAVSGDSEEI